MLPSLILAICNCQGLWQLCCFRFALPVLFGSHIMIQRKRSNGVQRNSPQSITNLSPGALQRLKTQRREMTIRLYLNDMLR